MDKDIKNKIKKGISRDNIRGRMTVHPNFVPMDEYSDHIIRSILSSLDSKEIAIVYIKEGILKVDSITNEEL